MLKKLGRIGFAILLVSLMILCCIFAFRDNKKSVASSEGHISVIIKNIDGDIVSNERFEYDKGDSLFKIIDKHYKLKYQNSVYGHFLTGINKISTDGMSSWLWLEYAYLKPGEEYNDNIELEKYDIFDSEVGIDLIELKDNMIFGITERDSTHTISAFSDDVKYVKSASDYKVFKYIVYALLALLMISMIIYAFATKKGSKTDFDVRKMCILSLMAVILFVQEEALSMLPNIQLTFLLISIYAAVFGIKYSSIIVVIHVILDNMVMGSLSPIVMIPMLMGYIVLVIVMYLVKNTGLVIKCICASLCALLYCYLFLIANALFLDINVYVYWISDIPFEILLVLSTILTITYLYNPLEKLLSREWNKSIDL